MDFSSFPSGHPLNRQYQGLNRIFLDHYQEDTDKTTGSQTDIVNTGTDLAVWIETTMSPGSSKGARLGWNTTGTSYRVDLPVIDEPDLDMLAFRVGQLYETSDNYNVFGESQDYSVSIVVDGTESALLKISDYKDLVYPARVYLSGSENSKSVMDTVRIPLKDFNGGADLATADVEAVIFTFDQKASGLLNVDEIQFTKQ
jgi:hypothetical protein